MYTTTTKEYTLASFLSNLNVFLASLPPDFEHGNKDDVSALPHEEVVKAQYWHWLENIAPKCLRVEVIHHGRNGEQAAYICMQESSSLVNPIVCSVTSDFITFYPTRYFQDELSANVYLNKRFGG